MIGGVLMIVGIVAAFLGHGPLAGFGFLLGTLAVGLVGFRIWLHVFPRSRFGKRLILANDAKDWHGFSDKVGHDLVGKDGVAHSMLRPAGAAIIDGKRYDVVTRGELIDPKTRIRVIDVKGNRIVVTGIAEDVNATPGDSKTGDA